MHSVPKIIQVEKDILQYIRDAESVKIIKDAFLELKTSGITAKLLKNMERISVRQEREIHTRDEVIRSLRIYINFLEAQLEAARKREDE